MCGLAGFAGLPKGDATKLVLTLALGKRIDQRGGHGIGFISITEGQAHTTKTSGTWKKATNDFLIEAAQSDLLLMHSRYATCGEQNQVSQAHPFTIHRRGRVVLYGAHNGIIYDAWESAKLYGRNIEVDSEELFHLIADQQFHNLRMLEGYGIAMWVESKDPSHIKLVRLSDDGEIVVAKLREGGYVWASTEEILGSALNIAGLHPKWILNVAEVGRVFEIHADKVVVSKTKDIKVAERWSFNSGSSNYEARLL